MTRQDVRNLVTAVVAGTVAASLVAVISIVVSAPRVWPGAVVAFVVNSGLAWLRLDRHTRRPR
jgi:hypothetical protein